MNMEILSLHKSIMTMLKSYLIPDFRNTTLGIYVDFSHISYINTLADCPTKAPQTT